MPEEELLPKLQTDLPLPEKELPPKAESKPKFSIFRNKIFIGFVIVSFLAAFLIGGFALGKNQNKTVSLSPSPSPTKQADKTSNWKTYTNAQIGFSILYPSTWTEAITTKKFQTDADVFDFTSSDFAWNQDSVHSNVASGTQLSILTQNNNILQTYEAYKNFLENSPSGQTKGFRQEQEITISGIKVLVLTGRPGSGIVDAAYTYYNGRAWEFLLKSNQDQTRLFNQILSTFKFTNSEGAFCGGIAGKVCPTGYNCKLDGNYPDAGGICVSN